MARKRVASWYWNITAMLTPLVLLVTLFWMYYTSQIHSYQAEAAAIHRSFMGTNSRDQTGVPREMARLYNHMQDLWGWVGFDAGDPRAVRSGPDVVVPRADLSVGAEFRNQPDKQSVTLQYYLAMERQFYGTGQSPEQTDVYRYASARRWISNFEGLVRNYVNSKSAQHYAIESILFEDDASGLQRLLRAGEEVDGMFRPALEAGDGTVADPRLRGPGSLTMEAIYRRQLDLLQSLYGVNQHQYNLLVGEVPNETGLRDSAGQVLHTGFEGERRRAEAIGRQVTAFQGATTQRTRTASDGFDQVQRSLGGISGEIDARKRTELENLVLAAAGRISALQAEFETERAMHQGDAARFDDMLRGLPRLKAPTRLEKSNAVGEITYSDFARGVSHINLGSADGVKAGQRFEVWRQHGREQDQMIAVVEIVRTLSAHYSLVTVLSLLDSNEPVRKGDKLFSLLWHDGRFLTIALHGDFEPPAQSYSKERLTELLRQMGCRVVDRVQPGVDLVILGSNLIGDEWYRAARNDLRFSTVREEAVRLYVDPR